MKSFIKRYLRLIGHALTVTSHDKLDVIIDQNNRTARSQTAVLQSAIHGVTTLNRITDDLARRQVIVETDDPGVGNPETGLLSYLYSWLPTRRMLDIGAHLGVAAQRLLATGYEVYAFEPFPPVYEKLTGRLGKTPGFHAFDCALGAEGQAQAELSLAVDGSASNRYGDVTVFNSLAPHAMPTELSFAATVPVPVRTLAGMHGCGALPPAGDIAIVKIDTEGFDLEVVHGMAEHRYPVVSAGFWDEQMPFAAAGAPYTLSTLVQEMRQRGHPWHVVLYKLWGDDRTAFYCNHEGVVPNSWGRVLFFRDHEIFAEAQRWCEATLARTFFKPDKATKSAAMLTPGEVTQPQPDAQPEQAAQLQNTAQVEQTAHPEPSG